MCHNKSTESDLLVSLVFGQGEPLFFIIVAASTSGILSNLNLYLSIVYVLATPNYVG